MNHYIQKIIYPFFNALPNDVPVGWLIPFLYIVEGILVI